MRELDTDEISHLQRMETALFNSYDLSGVVRYLEEKTYLKGDRYSFKDHEFQETILTDTSSVVNVQKCAQVGMSEAMARYALAVCSVMPYFSVIMTMPHAADAANFAKTRLDPIINETPDLKNKMDKELDNSEVKGIDNSLLYMRGCSGTTAALSVPADMLIHDELDRSDPAIVGQYQSRIKHSKHKLTRKFGTPTLEGKGIALEMAASRRHRMACVCNHCNESFIPSFHANVIVPGYNDGLTTIVDGVEKKNEGALKDITKYNINKIRWQEAFLQCPHCKEEPSLQMEHRAWVCENPQADFTAIGYYVTPFEVPNVVTIPSLIMEITKYASWGEFVNQALGETINNEESQLTATDVAAAMWQDVLNSGEMHNLGIDVGQTCHALVGRMTGEGTLLVVHKERIKLAELKIRKAVLKRLYRCVITVIDAYPETNLVNEMQKVDKNLFGAQYIEGHPTVMFAIKEADKDVKEGKLPLKVVKIARNLSLDELMNLFKGKKLWWYVQRDAEDDIFQSHCTDMSRGQIFDKVGKVYWNWSKSLEQQDHYFHTLNYLHVACRLQPTVSKNLSFGHVPLVMKLKMTEKKVGQVA
jgi:hypothetical protein